MVFELFRGSGDSQVDLIEDEVGQMLATATETLQLALDTLTRRRQPEEVGDVLRKRDKSINKVERTIRRQLIIHTGVRGALADAPVLFVYMSIAKDIERVGDMAKDLWRLAAAGGDMSDQALREIADDTGKALTDLISATARTFAERDAERAVAILQQADETVDHYEERMLAQLRGSDPTVAVTLALFYRLAMRITAHLMNVLTAVVMPFERLDYWDEDKVDREP